MPLEDRTVRDGHVSYARTPDESYTPSDDVNPICGCHRRSMCLSCGTCTSCDDCYCGED
jgi:hypothetical protein